MRHDEVDPSHGKLQALAVFGYFAGGFYDFGRYAYDMKGFK